MKSPFLRPPVRAIDAYAETLEVAPTLARQSGAFGGISVVTWETPWLDSVVLPQTDDLILSLHSGGSRAIRWRHGARLSGERCVPGAVTLIPPGQSVDFYVGGPVVCTNLHISRLAVRQILNEEHEPTVSDRFAFHDPFVVSCMDRLLQEARRNGRWSQRFVGAVAEALILHLLRRDVIAPARIFPSTAQQRIAAARDHIDSNLAGNLSLTRLAADVGMSRAHFARVFRQSVDEPPHHYVMRRRLDRAASLLAETDLPLKHIAQEAGFSSQAHLTHLFRKHRGVTLLGYRRLIAQPCSR